VRFFALPNLHEPQESHKGNQPTGTAHRYGSKDRGSLIATLGREGNPEGFEKDETPWKRP